MEFEWDADKAVLNKAKHGVTFDEAASAFADPSALIAEDPDHSEDEVRAILIGSGSVARVIVVSYTIRGEAIRIISARKATPAECRQYAN